MTAVAMHTHKFHIHPMLDALQLVSYSPCETAYPFDSFPLPPEPALWRFCPSLQDDIIHL